MTSKTDLYRQYDKDGKLLYVGVSINARTRHVQHKSTSFWIDEVATITIEKHPDRETALAAEKSAISSEKPVYNDQYAEKRRVRPEPLSPMPMFGPPAPYRGRPVGLVSGEVPEGFPVPPERIFRADHERAVERVVKVCWPKDTIHVLNADFPAHLVPGLQAEGINVIFH
jgi:predicted GIY-YIG superfamily endonuclease